MATSTDGFPLTPLDTLRAFLQYHPYHFWGMTNQTVPVNSKCNTIVPEYGYQMGYGIGRYELRQRLAYAEEKAASYLGYDIAPRYRTDLLEWPRTVARSAWGSGGNSYGQSLAVRTERGYIQAIGVEVLDAVQENATVYYTKSITPLDSFTVSIATTVTDPDEIAIYFSNTERYDGSAASARWRIEPVSVSISAGIATITGAAWLLVKPQLFQSFVFTNLAPALSTNFVTTVDIVRRYTDPDGMTITDSQGSFVWEAPNCGCGTTNPYAQDPAAVGQSVARVGIRDAIAGWVTPGAAQYNSTSTPPQWVATGMPGCTPPDRVYVRYLAGLPLINRQTNPFWSEIICMLTLAELPGPICACAETNKRIEHWQLDLARSSGNGGEQYAYIASEDLSNPFGTRRGHIEAWKRVKELRNQSGIGL